MTGHGDAVAVVLQASGPNALGIIRSLAAEGVPVMATDAWVPERLGRRITAAALARRPLYEILMAQGIEFGRVVQEITAVPADPQHAALLGVNVGSPMLRLTRVLYAIDRVPVMHITIHVSPERSRILMDVAVESLNTLGAGQITHDAPRL